jgi:hypothetical protein
MFNTHMKKCSLSLTIKEIHSKNTIRFHLTPVRITTIKNTNNNNCWRACGEKPHEGWWECKLVQLLWKALWRLLRKLKIELSYDPGKMSEGMQVRIQ